MAEYIEREAVNMDGCSELNKIKTDFAKVIVGGTPEKPYYEILYFNPADRSYYIGFGSYCLEYVIKWLREKFEIVEEKKAATAKWLIRVLGVALFIAITSLAGVIVWLVITTIMELRM